VRSPESEDLVKLRSQILAGVGVVVVGLMAIIIYLYTNLDSIVKREIESYGSKLTGTVVRVDSVKISPTSGEGTIRGLTIANPSGYTAGNAFELDSIHVQVQPSTLTSDLLVVDKVIVDSPRIHYVMSGVRDSNISKIIDNVKASDSGGSASSGSSSDSGDSRMVIRRFSFRGGEMNAESEVPLGKDLEVKLPALSLSNVGGSGGASPSEVGKEILDAYLTRVVIVVASTQLQKVVSSELEKATGKIPGPAGDIVNGVVKDVFKLVPGAKD